MNTESTGLFDSPMDYNPKAVKVEGYQIDSLLSLYQDYTTRIKSLEGIEFAHNTFRRYNSSLNSLKRFLDNRDVRISTITHIFASNYYYYLITKEKLQSNSAYKNIKALHRVLNFAAENDLIPFNPCKRFKCKYKNPNRPYLTETEINTLYSLRIKEKYLARVRDVFLFQVYTGLSYADISAITKRNIEIGVDGNEWIIIHRKKTGERSAIPILPRAKEILFSYNYSLPIISNQKMNKYLKVIADLAKITKKLTTHCGRHTFATTITLSNGVPIETVSKVLGHSNISTTQIYAKIVDSKVAKDFSALMI